MNRTTTITAQAVRGLLPARLADAQIDHMERMVQYWTRAHAGLASRGIDHDYWKKRLRALGENYDLVASQRQRLDAMLAMLDAHREFSA
jgi:hypothetical protein